MRLPPPCARIRADAVDRGDRRAEVEEELLLDPGELVGDQVVGPPEAEVVEAGGAHRVNASAVQRLTIVRELQRDAEVAPAQQRLDRLQVVLGPPR